VRIFGVTSDGFNVHRTATSTSPELSKMYSDSNRPLGMFETIRTKEQAKLQWLQDPSQINGDNLNNAKHEANRYFRNKKREYLKDKINNLAPHIKAKDI
jgi:hypothetical protein